MLSENALRMRVSSEDLDQHALSRSLIRISTGRILAKDAKFLHSDNKDSDQTARMHRLI